MRRKNLMKKAERLLAEAEKAFGSDERISKAYQADSIAIELGDVALAARCDKILDMTGPATPPMTMTGRAWGTSLKVVGAK